MSVHDLMPILIPGLLIQIAIVAYYIRHCWENPNLTNKQKTIWIILIAITNLLASAFYLIATLPKSNLMRSDHDAAGLSRSTGTASINSSGRAVNRLPTTDKVSDTGNIDLEGETGETPYSKPSQTKQAIVLFLITAYEVFALRMIFENQHVEHYPLHVVMAAIIFVVLLVICFFYTIIKPDFLRRLLPFISLPAAAVLVYLDSSQSSTMMIMAIVAILINSYPLKMAKIHFAVYFITYISATIMRTANAVLISLELGGLFTTAGNRDAVSQEINLSRAIFNDQMIGALYSDILFFLLVFAAFYSLKKQYMLNDRLESVLAMTQKQALEIRELSVINERQRIIGEIHDTVGHTLTTAIIALEDGSELLKHEPSAALEKIKLAQQQTRQSLDDLRGAIRTLQHGESKSFTDRLGQLLDVIRRTTDLDVNFVFDLVTDPLPIQQTVMLNAVKEFSTNSLKHGRSRTIDILLQEFDNAYHLTISDDGIGTDTIVFGFGLTTIRNRAESLGGTMRAESKRDDGFSLYIVLPAGIQTDDDTGRNVL